MILKSHNQHAQNPECLARIIHEWRLEAFETEARRGFSQVRPTEAYWQSIEQTAEKLF